MVGCGSLPWGHLPLGKGGCVSGQEALERGEGFGADVVFDTLGVGACRGSGNSDGLEERGDDAVPVAGMLGQSPAVGGEEDRTVRLGGDEAVPLKAAHRLQHGDMGNSEAPGDVHGAGLAAGFDQVGDGFYVVFGDLGAVLLPCASMNRGLVLGALTGGGTPGALSGRRHW